MKSNIRKCRSSLGVLLIKLVFLFSPLITSLSVVAPPPVDNNSNHPLEYSSASFSGLEQEARPFSRPRSHLPFEQL